MSEKELPPIPPNWCWAPLGEIAEVKLGKMLSAKAFEDGLLQLPYLRNQNVRWGHINYSDLKTMGFKPSEVERYSLEPGDLLVCEGGEPGRCATYSRGSKELMYQKALHRIRPYGGLTLTSFLQFCLWHYASNGVVLPRPSETTIQHLPLEEMQMLRIPVVPIKEQHRIVEEIEKHFTGLDAAIASLVRVQANLKRYRAAVLKAACEGRTNPLNNQSEMRQVAKLVSLADVLAEDLANGRSVPTQENGFPVLRLGAISEGKLNLKIRKGGAWARCDAAPFLIQRGDFFVSRGNGSLSLLGRGGLVEQDPDEVAFPDTMIRIRLDPARYDVRFLRLIWDSLLIRQQIEIKARTTAGIYKISQTDLRAIFLPLFSLEHQRYVVERFEQVLSVLEQVASTAAAQKRRATLLRQSVLETAFQGRLVPQDPNDEPASALLERIRQAKTSQSSEPRARKSRPKPAPAPPSSPPPTIGANFEPPEEAQARSPGREPRVEGTPLIPKPPEGATARGSRSAVPEETRNLLSPRRGSGNHDDPQTRGSRPGLHAGAPPGGSEWEPMPPPPIRAAPQEAHFLELSRDEQLDILWQALLGKGTLERDVAIRTAADALRALGLARFQRLRHDGPLYGTIAAGIERGVREGDFDRPRRGSVRAVLSDSKGYTDEVWQQCLLAVTGAEPAEIEATLRAAAEWARETMGLEYARLREDGVILTGLREALEVEVRAGRIVRRGGRVRRG